MAASIEIRNFLGDVETRTLSKNQPISIGQHRTNDIHIDEDDVAALHCRISWNKSGYEVVAANPNGVEVNSTIVQRAALLDGDVVRVGTVDIALRTDEGPPVAAAAAAESSDDIRLSPISEDELRFPGIPLARAPIPAEEFDGSNAATADDGPDETDEPRQKKRKKSRESRKKKRNKDQSPDEQPKTDKLDDLFAELESDGVDGKPTLERSVEHAGTVDREKADSDASLRTRLKGRAARPGEQEITSSPFVIMLMAGGLALLLVAAIIFLVIGRQTSQTRYDSAVAHMNEGKYAQAIDEFEAFIDEYPRHELTPLARVSLDKSRIESHIAGATPSWERGLSALQDFIERQSNRPSFSDLHETIVGFGGRISEGAAVSAKATLNREFLKISADAQRILERFAPLDDPPLELQDRIAAAVRDADLTILRHETYEEAVDDIAALIAKDKPLEGLEIRRQLLNRYSDFEQDRRLDALLENCLDAERDLVQADAERREPLTDEPPGASPPPLSLTPNQRSRTGEASSGEVVFAVAKDCCYGIDSATGNPLWRRVIGLDTPFFPMTVETAVRGLLVYDSNRGEVALLDQRNGQSVWRQPLADDPDTRPAGPPLIHEEQGQIYLPTLDQRLYQIDAETGSITAELEFRQPLWAPPVLDADGQRLFVAGDRDVIYTLSTRPLQCQTVSYLNHQAGTLRSPLHPASGGGAANEKSPLLPMGSLLLMSQSDRQDSAQLRALDTRGQRLEQVALTRLDGHVDSQPIMYGNRLFVPFGRERIAIYSVTDEPGEDALKLIARHNTTSSYPGKSWLLAGPDEQFWMAGSALRRFTLKTDTIEADPRQLAVGLSTQPLQMRNQYLYAGRRQPYHQAVIFSRAHRENMTSNWRTVLGAAPLAFGGAADRSLVVVTEAGDVFRISQGEMQRGGFKRSSIATLNVHESTSQPLRAVRLPDGRLAVAAGQPDPQLWVINSGGQFDLNAPIDEPPQADPILIEAGVVLPLPQRLRLIRTGGAGSPVEDYLPPRVSDAEVRWSFLIGGDTNELLAIDTSPALTKIRYRDEPNPHLAEAARLELDQPVDVPPSLNQDRLLLADRAGQLRVIDVLTLTTIHQFALPGPASSLYWLDDDLVVAATATELIAGVLRDGELEQVVTHQLNPGDGLAGKPVVEDSSLIVALRGGEVLRFDASRGSLQTQTSVGQPLVSGPMEFGDQLVVASIDGSLHRIDVGTE